MLGFLFPLRKLKALQEQAARRDNEELNRKVAKELEKEVDYMLQTSKLDLLTLFLARNYELNMNQIHHLFFQEMACFVHQVHGAPLTQYFINRPALVKRFIRVEFATIISRCQCQTHNGFRQRKADEYANDKAFFNVFNFVLEHFKAVYAQDHESFHYFRTTLDSIKKSYQDNHYQWGAYLGKYADFKKENKDNMIAAQEMVETVQNVESTLADLYLHFSQHLLNQKLAWLEESTSGPLGAISNKVINVIEHEIRTIGTDDLPVKALEINQHITATINKIDTQKLSGEQQWAVENLINSKWSQVWRDYLGIAPALREELRTSKGQNANDLLIHSLGEIKEQIKEIFDAQQTNQLHQLNVTTRYITMNQ